MFLWQLQSEGLLALVHTYLYVDDLMLVFPAEHDFDLVQRVLDYMERVCAVSRLKINPDKSKWMKKTVWISMEPLMYDLGYQGVSAIKYLGVLMGDVLTEEAYSVLMITALHKARVVASLWLTTLHKA